MTLNPLAWLRTSVLAAVVLAVFLATASGTVEAGKIHPNSRTGRAITRLATPFVGPVRRTVEVGGGGLRLGYSFWFGITAVVTGALAASCLEWLAFPKRGIGEAATAPTRRTIAIAITVAFGIVLLLVLCGLWGSLRGAPRGSWWMAPFSLPTAWAVDGLAGKVPRVAALNLAAGVLYAALRIGRWFFVRAT
ncbi:MAG: hypothetical protein A2085_06420 [Gemmatimonadetes bacterium GWC2_71_10]|nr:MAG: hypothetical protein A2085_06420 [Gemmatimonadetes bacterium GWC2_71_10]